MKQLNWYQIFGKSNIPDGRTVLPTDDIQIWLNCANIWDKTYTTLAEVLADTDTLLALISSSNAVDYMVRSTTWAVSQALVPTMTSNTTPSGVCSASEHNADAYYAFNGQYDNGWIGNGHDQYLTYDFEMAVSVEKFEYWYNSIVGSVPTLTPTSLTILSSNDDISYSEIGTYSLASNTNHVIDFTNPVAGRFFRARVNNCNQTATGVDRCIIGEMQYHSASITTNQTAMSYIGLNNYCANTLLADSTWCEAICNSGYFESVLNVKVPTMTSNTTPSGECFANSEYSSRRAYCAFDGTSNAWQTNNTASSFSNIYVGYEFESEVVTAKAEFAVGTPQITAMTYKIQGSTDGNTWDDLTSNLTTYSTALTTVPFGNVGRYSHYRMLILSQTHSTSERGGMISTLQFYGREDV